MTGARRAALLLLLLPFLCVPAQAAPSALSSAHPRTSWSGTLTVPDPAGCGDALSHGCVWHDLVVDAPAGAWITVTADDGLFLHVQDGDHDLGSSGTSQSATRGPTADQTPRVTFAQVRTGRVRYSVGVSSVATDLVNGTPFSAHAALAGKAFDREGDCFVGDAGTAALLAKDDGRRLSLNVRLVGDPRDSRVVHAAGAGLVDIYDRIGITVHVSYDLFHLQPVAATDYPFDQVRVRYHGVRPPGVDVVHVITDLFAGGFADCIGGIAYPEKAFSTGNAHYSVQGAYTVDRYPAALIAAHEIGHLLGGQHQMVSCAEAAPQLAVRPAKDGSVGPCTEMGPLVVQDSETWSTAERAAIRDAVRRYAGR